MENVRLSSFHLQYILKYIGTSFRVQSSLQTQLSFLTFDWTIAIMSINKVGGVVLIV